jgi:branched-chain amino acid transport system ATP-binding protein
VNRLRVEHLEVRYGDLVGIADVSLDVQPGSIVALLGSNGAGKTTTLNAIRGLVPPSGGTIEWRGAPIGGSPAYAIVSKVSRCRRKAGAVRDADRRAEPALGATVLSDKGRIAALYERVYALFSAPRRAPQATRRHAVRRRAQMLALGRALMSEPASC